MTNRMSIGWSFSFKRSSNKVRVDLQPNIHMLNSVWANLNWMAVMNAYIGSLYCIEDADLAGVSWPATIAVNGTMIQHETLMWSQYTQLFSYPSYDHIYPSYDHIDAPWCTRNAAPINFLQLHDRLWANKKHLARWDITRLPSLVIQISGFPNKSHLQSGFIRWNASC